VLLRSASFVLRIRMMFRSMIVLSFLCLGCGGSDEPAAASDTSGAEATPAITSVVTDVWLVVRAVEGRGLAVGSGVRFHASAFDVVSRGQANTFSLTCPAEGTWVCEGPGGSIQLEVIDGALRVTQPGLVLTLDAASEAQSTTFEATLAASLAQQTACRRAADCCVALDNAGHGCDLAAVLGDRTRTACDAGFATLTSRVASEQLEAPEACR
jgi:hypothetical protein